MQVLTRDAADSLGREAAAQTAPVLIAFERSSPEARAVLRQRGVSYVAANGELFVYAPPIYVERPGRASATTVAPPLAAPFATRASRVSRWLLLHPEKQSTSFRELARAVALSEALVSRTVRALADDGLVAIDSDLSDARLRLARLREAGPLLDAFERAVIARRPRRVTWDIGARDVAAALDVISKAGARLSRPYAIGGLAGAASIRRVVEPADVTVWIARDDVDVWAEELIATPARPAPGRVTAYLSPDPWVLSLARPHEGVQVADPVQLYLDCRVAGERALEAAEAIRAAMHW